MTEAEKYKLKFNDIRQIRNTIAHGEINQINLSKVNEANSFLRRFAAAVDRFIVCNYVPLPNFLENH